MFDESWFRVCEEKQATVKGTVWQLNNKDDDHWPSAQHAHDYELNRKVDLFTGNIFSVTTGLFERQMRKKELAELRYKLKWTGGN